MNDGLDLNGHGCGWGLEKGYGDGQSYGSRDDLSFGNGEGGSYGFDDDDGDVRIGSALSEHGWLGAL
jgi:hypothetical protein